MARKKLPSGSKCCATCLKWGGERKPSDQSMTYVEFEDDSKGKCNGGAYNKIDKLSTAHCSKWERQYKK